MKQVFLKSIIWFLVAWIGSISIVFYFGIDLSEVSQNAGIFAFGSFIGVMATYLGGVFKQRQGE